MRPIKSAFNVGAGPNLVREALVEPDWLRLIHPCGNPRLKSATNQKFEVFRTILLHVRIRDILVREMFVIVSKLAVLALLCTHFIAKGRKSILRINREIISFNSPPVQILVVLEATDVGTAEKRMEAFASFFPLLEQEPNLACVAQMLGIQPLIETLVSVASSARSIV